MGAEPNEETDMDGLTPLRVAVYYTRPDVVPMLLAAGAHDIADPNVASLLQLLVLGLDFTCDRITGKSDVDTDAVRRIAQSLVAIGIDPNFHCCGTEANKEYTLVGDMTEIYMSPLSMVISRTHETYTDWAAVRAVIDILLDIGASPNGGPQCVRNGCAYPLRQLARNFLPIEIVRLIIGRGADVVNEDAESVMREAVKYDHNVTHVMVMAGARCHPDGISYFLRAHMGHAAVTTSKKLRRSPLSLRRQAVNVIKRSIEKGSMTVQTVARGAQAIGLPRRLEVAIGVQRPRDEGDLYSFTDEENPEWAPWLYKEDDGDYDS